MKINKIIMFGILVLALTSCTLDQTIVNNEITSSSDEKSDWQSYTGASGKVSYRQSQYQIFGISSSCSLSKFPKLHQLLF